MKKNEHNYKTIIDLLFVSGIILFMLLALAKSILKPTLIANNENRYADSYDKLSFKAYLKGNLQSNFEKTLSDQMILTSKMRSANNLLDAAILKVTLNSIAKNHKLDYYNLGSTYAYGTDNLVYYPYVLSEHIALLEDKVTELNKIMQDYPQVKYYFYYIEKDSDINFNDNSKLMAYEYLKDNLASSNITKFEINNFEEFQKYFYKTDHHWNYEGSYRAYLELLEMFGFDNPKTPKGIDCFNKKFVGSKAMAFTMMFNEDLCYYVIDYDDLDTYVNGKKGEYGFQGGIVDKNVSHPTYHTYYGLDRGEVIFDTKDDSKDNILILGESFDNAVIRLFAEKFNRTMAVDLRHYEKETGKKFNYGEYLENNDIDEVLFIGNINYWASDEFNVVR